jgi:hypothetical protein
MVDLRAPGLRGFQHQLHRWLIFREAESAGVKHFELPSDSVFAGSAGSDYRAAVGRTTVNLALMHMADARLPELKRGPAKLRGLTRGVAAI